MAWVQTLHGYPAVFANPSGTHVAVAGGQAQLPSGTVWFLAGGADPFNYGVIRFTAPVAGTYALDTQVESLYSLGLSSGGYAGDTDFHVVLNGTEVFGELLDQVDSTTYVNTFFLAKDDTVDFAVGRGQDHSLNGSALKIKATFSCPSCGPAQTSPGTVQFKFPNYQVAENGGFVRCLSAAPDRRAAPRAPLIRFLADQPAQIRITHL